MSYRRTENSRSSVAAAGNTAVIGAPGDKIGANNSQGSAYVFSNISASFNRWSQQAKLMLSSGAAEDRFGSSVAISGDLAIVGAMGKTFLNRPKQGAAFVYSRGGTAWSLRQPLTASDGRANGYFGARVALGGDAIIVSALRDGSAAQGTASGLSLMAWS